MAARVRRRVKRQDRVLERRVRPTQASVQARHLEDPVTYHQRLAAQTWLNSIEAADYLRKPSVRAFRRWLKEVGLVPGRGGGRTILVKRAVLDQAVQAGNQHSVTVRTFGTARTPNSVDHKGVGR
jgi:hypothetical protein